MLKATPCSGSDAVVRSEGSGTTPSSTCRSRMSVISVTERTGLSSLSSGMALGIRSLGADRSRSRGAVCVSREVPDAAGSSVGRAGSPAWGRRSGRGRREQRARPRSWKAEQGRVLGLQGGSRSAAGFALGSGSGIKFFLGLAMPQQSFLLRTCFLEMFSPVSPTCFFSKLLMLPLSVTQTL